MKKLRILEEYNLIGEHKLPELGYSYDSLEPYIDARTMEIHHTKHHQTYIDNLNKALADHPDKNKPLLEIFRDIEKYPVAVRNNGGGHYNHTLFWKILSKPTNPDNKPSNEFLKVIEKHFGSFEEFKNQFSQAALNRFGSGWAWLCVDDDSKLHVCSTPNQDNPLMNLPNQCGGYPILGIDVWEHAYYLKYQNRRAEYVANFWNVINWAEVEKRYNAIIG